MNADDRKYLARAFEDILNYEADDQLKPIDPLTYLTPEGDSCLHLAAGRGDLRVVQLLLDADLDAGARGDLGHTPLHYAHQGHFPDVVDLLLIKGADSTLVNELGEAPGSG